MKVQIQVKLIMGRDEATRELDTTEQRKGETVIEYAKRKYSSVVNAGGRVVIL